MFGPFAFLGPVFTFVIIIVALGIFGGIVKERIKAKENNNVPDEFLEEFDRRLERLETRIANIETIVLEKEKYKKFSDL